MAAKNGVLQYDTGDDFYDVGCTHINYHLPQESFVIQLFAPPTLILLNYKKLNRETKVFVAEIIRR